MQVNSVTGFLKYAFLMPIVVMSELVNAQIHEEPIMLITKNCNIQGTLTLPRDKVETIVLIISGPGTTDRDGNNRAGLRTDAYKMYAWALADQNIASVRYDKRGLGASRISNFHDGDLRFAMFVDDVKMWVDILQKRFPKVIVAGHGEGALVGLAAISEGCRAAGFISIAGMGRSIGEVLKQQMSVQPSEIRDIANAIIDTMAMGRVATQVPIYLRNNFHKSIQPYIISMFKYNPQVLISTLKVPTLIIQGDTDLQITVDDSKKLAAANRQSTLVIIPGMNHALKSCTSLDQAAQNDTFLNPSYPLKQRLVTESVKFIQKIDY